MEAATASQHSQQDTRGGGRTRPHRQKPARRGRGNNSNAGSRPETDSSQPSNATAASSESHPSGRGNSRQRGNDRGRGAGRRIDQAKTVNGRQFGGQLTRQETNESAQSGPAPRLQAEAPVFVPGQVHAAAATKSTPKQPKQPRKQRAPKSQAPDIATRTHEDIDNGYYECPICTSEVQRNSKVWACHDCWTVFHLGCVKKWSTNEGSAAGQRRTEDGEMPPPRQWRCPGCNLPQDDFPKVYTCWCGKETDPRSTAGLPPHSCGNTCGRERARKCPHPCQLTCHAGPCPPCTHMGPTQVCFCGKHEVTKRCSETNYDTGWSCGEVCGEVMGCGEHNCTRTCHEGSCGSCEVRVPARCYCGQSEKDILCQDRGDAKDSKRVHPAETGEEVVESWTGTFDCGNICDRPFDCGLHTCKQICHVQAPQPTHCPDSPDVVTHCPCGKTPLEELSPEPRQSCADSIPHCKQICDKLLPCGHHDEQLCHAGDCSSCMKMVDIKCRCGRTTSRTVCHQGQEEPPQCMRTCRVTLNCGRHACDEHCCPGERKAAERQSSRRKHRPINSAPRSVDDGFEAEHICTRQCGRLLKCGTHFCTELCHKGPCGTCREAIFEEISCHCGRTVLQPPLPCGTKPPPCRFPCNRSKACGHPQVAHNCHEDDEACPKCPFLMEKRCMCGKKALKNQQCWLQDVRCGEVCGKKLKCGVHFCRKLCHRSGECEDAHGQPCSQPCGKEKKVCGHPDLENTCHAPFPCKEDKPCQSKIFITCVCQAQKQEMKCGASTSSDGNAEKVLPCNEECARLERNRKLALALNIDQTTHVEGGDHIPYSAETLNIFAEHVKWGQTQEREFRVFATSDDERRMRFKPMQARQRAFVHALAEDFGLDSESMDPEPHRHVMIWKTPRFVSPPNKTLAEALRIRQAQRSVTVSANVSDNEAPKKTRPSNVASQPYNAFLISNPRFGLTIDELRIVSNEVLHPITPFTFDIEFLPSEEVVLKANSRTLSPEDLQKSLEGLKLPLASAIASKSYGSAQLCVADSSLNILRKESDGAGKDGWSRVAAKKAAPKVALSSGGFAGGNSFAALAGNKVTFAKKTAPVVAKTPAKKKVKEAVVDDWEAAELAEEEKEKAVSGDELDAGGVAPTEGDALASSEAAEITATASPEASASPEATAAPEAAATGSPEENATLKVDGSASEGVEMGTDQQDWADQVEASAS